MRLVIGGQIERELIKSKVQSLVGESEISIEVKGDIDAAMAVKTGQADYYFGACNTGAGGALAMAIAILGADKCATVGMPGKILSETEIVELFAQGKSAFGFTGQDFDVIVPILINEIKKKI